MEGLPGAMLGSARTGRLRTACEGCESQGNGLGLRLRDNRESLKVSGDGIDTGHGWRAGAVPRHSTKAVPQTEGKSGLPCGSSG